MGAIYPAGATNLYGETLALSATLASLGMPGIETKQAIIYNPDSDYRLHINPAIKSIWFYDNSQTGTAKWVNLKTHGIDLTDRTTTGSGTTLDTITTADRLLICFSDVVGGYHVDMTASVNTTNSRVMVCEYPVLAVWTGLTETDGTIETTARSLGKDGDVTFPAPTDWASNHFGGDHKYGAGLAIDDVDSGINTNESLDAADANHIQEIAITMDADPSSAIVAGDYIIIESEVMHVQSSSATANLVVVNRGALGSTVATHTTNKDVYIYRFDCPDATQGFWLKMNWTGGSLHTDVEIQDLWSLNKNTNRGYFHAGVEYPLSFDRRNTGSIEAVLTAGSSTMEVNWIRTII